MNRRHRQTPAFDCLESRRLLDGSMTPMGPPQIVAMSEMTVNNPDPDIDPETAEIDNDARAETIPNVMPAVLHIAASSSPVRDTLVSVIEAARTGMNNLISNNIKTLNDKIAEADTLIDKAQTRIGVYSTLPDTPKNRKNIAVLNEDIDFLMDLKTDMQADVFDMTTARTAMNSAVDALIGAIKVFTDPMLGITWYSNDELDYVC